jgi:tetratricopeptide (TPR) repeat protein
MMRSRAISFSFLIFFFLPLLCQAQSKSLLDTRRSLSGKVVVGGDDRAAGEARVELRQLTGNLTMSAPTNHDGEFSFAGLTFGTYRVTAMAPECAPVEETIQLDSSSAPLLLQLRKSTLPPGNGAVTVSAHELSIPEKARKAFNKGSQRLAAKDSAGSIPEFQRAIQIFPAYYEAYYKMGIAQLDLQQGENAEAAFRKSIELSAGRYAPPHSGLGLILCLQKRLSEAESAARTGVKLDPADAAGQYALALVLLTTNRLPEAEKTARQAVLSKPNFAEAYLLLADIHLRQSKAAALVEDLDAFLKLDPDGPASARVRAVREDAQRALSQESAGSELATANP